MKVLHPPSIVEALVGNPAGHALHFRQIPEETERWLALAALLAGGLIVLIILWGLLALFDNYTKKK
jgi:hypothetical protein